MGPRLTAITTDVDGERVRSLTAGEPNGLPEVVLVPGLGAPGYLIRWALAMAMAPRDGARRAGMALGTAAGVLGDTGGRCYLYVSLARRQ